MRSTSSDARVRPSCFASAPAPSSPPERPRPAGGVQRADGPARVCGYRRLRPGRRATSRAEMTPTAPGATSPDRRPGIDRVGSAAGRGAVGHWRARWQPRGTPVRLVPRGGSAKPPSRHHSGRYPNGAPRPSEGAVYGAQERHSPPGCPGGLVWRRVPVHQDLLAIAPPSDLRTDLRTKAGARHLAVVGLSSVLPGGIRRCVDGRARLPERVPFLLPRPPGGPRRAVGPASSTGRTSQQ